MTAPRTSFQNLLQELRTKRWTQVALVVMVLLCAYVFWPEAPKGRGRTASGSQSSTRLEPAQLQALRSLGDLAGLRRAGELPGEDRMYRDVFLFDTPPPPAPKPKPLPPPPPPSPEELKAAQLRAARQAEQGTQPSQLRYLGHLESRSSGRIGAFMKSEEPITLKKGQLVNPKWRLQELTDETAVFQNLTYTDMRYTLRATEAQAGGPQSASRAKSNEF
ncbi:hypothetical protein [Holophaga foetida]|uniref:hypothetical protein n=1 Tax=Holophaga foetida TaxID=35839 RepID=UPI0002472F50|nr:hypothetical protein [Holophaga foetida]